MADDYPVLELSGPSEALELGTALLQEYGLLGTEEVAGHELRAYFPASTDALKIARIVRERVPALSCAVSAPLTARDWLKEWKAGLEGFPIGERYFVLPTWKPDVATTRKNRIVLRIDPEQAFGTGTHETTRMCVELLEEHVTSGCDVVDVGTGTAILAMVAAHEGARSVRAIDNDRDAVTCARKNVERNGLAERVELACESWTDHDAIEANVVVANLNSAILTRAAHRFHGTVILSGILRDEVDELKLPPELERRELRTEGEWAALVLERERRG